MRTRRSGSSRVSAGRYHVAFISTLAFIGVAVTPVSAGDATAPRPNVDPPWRSHIRQVDAALLQRDVSGAERAWHEAYNAALRSRRWDGLLEVGNAYLRIGEIAHGRKIAAVKARQIYLAAVSRAHQQGEIDGVIVVAHAFAGLGEVDLVEYCLRIAERLGERTGDAKARERIAAARADLARRRSDGVAGSAGIDPLPLLSPDELAGP